MVPGRRSWSVDAEREDGVLGDGSSVLVYLLWGYGGTAGVLGVGGDRTRSRCRQYCLGLEAVSNCSVLAELSLLFQLQRALLRGGFSQW